MDAETKKIIEDHAYFLEKINSTYTNELNKLNKFDLITKQFIILDEVLKCYIKGQKMCCQEPRPKENCDISNLVQALIRALGTTLDNVPSSYIELITNKYVDFSNSLELMQRYSRTFRGRFVNCRITKEDMKRWREISASVHMLLLSKYDFWQEITWDMVLEKDTLVTEKEYHELMWTRLGKLGYTLPLVKYVGGIQEMEKKKPFDGTSSIIESHCSNCECNVKREDDCGLLSLCDHLYCIKCIYTMAAEKNVSCKVCKKIKVEWTTKDLISRSKAAHEVAMNNWNESMKTYSKIGVLTFFIGGYVTAGIRRLYGSME